MDFEEIFNNLYRPKTIKDIADKYPDKPKEKIIECKCPNCNKTLRIKVKV